MCLDCSGPEEIGCGPTADDMTMTGICTIRVARHTSSVGDDSRTCCQCFDAVHGGEYVAL